MGTSLIHFEHHHHHHHHQHLRYRQREKKKEKMMVMNTVVFLSSYYEQRRTKKGKFGIVRRCHEKSTNKKLAAKFINTTCPQDRKDVEREVDIMCSLQHPRLLQLYDAFDDGKNQMSCAIFVRQICEGLDYIHSKSIIHLDMKPENVLCVTRTGNRIKLIDFGFARKYDKGLQVMFGTPEFAAPEVINFEDVGYTTDMWAVGVITYVLLSGLSPFMGDSDWKPWRTSLELNLIQ
ncbi:Myosin light chain kinase 3 [Sarcoptes scabiei]|uniref:Myosin light chain kinase 3 n=1 Tax=Sarcoptes scabiei TaxID=52283 RepID=A0A834RHW8_SARSC|nr:Myosin light chain kinase 3 [Sarcoptes scabiei]